MTLQIKNLRLCFITQNNYREVFRIMQLDKHRNKSLLIGYFNLNCTLVSLAKVSVNICQWVSSLIIDTCI